MTYMLIALLAVGALLFVAYPVLTRRRYRQDFDDMFALGDVKQLNYLNQKKTLIMENLKELDFEYEMGKLSDDDYNALRQEYMKEAQDVVESIDKLRVREEIEQLIENDVRTRRKTE